MILRKQLGYIYSPFLGCLNPLATNFNKFANQDDGACVFEPNDIIAIINDEFPEHAESMLFIFKEEYGQDATLFNLQGDGDNFLFQYAKAIGCEVLIKSYPSIYEYLTNAFEYYPDVQMFMPLGSNQSLEILNPSSLPVIITCGAGNATDTQNKTAYGDGLEFWDNEGYFNPVDESSYSNPIIASKIMKIRDARDCSFWEARYCARITADRNEPNRPPDTIWHNLNGFGKINTQAAINYNGIIPRDPYLFAGDNVYTPFND